MIFFSKIIQKYQQAKITQYLVKAEFITDFITKNNINHYFYKNIKKSTLKSLFKIVNQYKYVDRKEIQSLRKKNYYLDASISAFNENIDSYQDINLEQIKTNILKNKNLQYKILNNSTFNSNKIFKNNLFIQLLKDKVQLKRIKLSFQPIYVLGLTFLIFFLFNIITVHLNINQLNSSIVLINNNSNSSIESHMKYVSNRKIPDDNFSIKKFLSDIFFPQYIKKYQIITKNKQKVFSIYSAKNKTNNEYQYINVMANSQITIFISNSNAYVKVNYGDIYYFGKKGLTTSFLINGLNIKLLGTKVLFNKKKMVKENSNQDISISVLEGRVSISKNLNDKILRQKPILLKAGYSFKYKDKKYSPNVKMSKKNIDSILLVEKISTKVLQKIDYNDYIKDSSTKKQYKELVIKKIKIDNKKKVKKVKKIYISNKKVYSDLESYYNKSIQNNLKAQIKIIIIDKNKSKNKVTGYIKKINIKNIEIQTLFGVFSTKLENIISYRKLN